MALPLPRVVADVGPGGPLVTAMGGMNSLANDMLLRKINAVKEQYAPLAAQADINSKNAYARLVGLQPLGKIIGNEMAYSNVPDATKAEINNRFLRAGGVGPLPFPDQNNALNQGSPNYPSNNNSLLGFITDKLKNHFNQNQASPNGNVENIKQGIAHVESGGSKDPYALIGKDTGKGDRALGKYQVLASNVPEWTKEALGRSLSPQEFLSSPEAQEKVAAYMISKHLSQGKSPQDIGSIWFSGKPLAQAGNVRDAYGTTPQQYISKMAEGMSGQKNAPTWAETAGQAKGIVKEGEELGKIRAASKKELDQDYQQALQLKAPFQELNKIISNPIFQNLRNIPGFQKLQLNAKANIGTDAEKKLIGEFQAAAQNVVASTVKGFGGRILASEIPLAESMKLSPNDSIGVMLGKAPVVEAFNEMTLQRSRIASNLMKQYHLDKGEALEAADKMVDGEAIRKNIENQLNPKPTNEDILHMAQKYNISVEDVKNRLKAKGLL